jgi:integrase
MTSPKIDATKPRGKKTLTDRLLKSLKPKADGKPFEVMDAVIRGFGVRILGKPNAPILTFIIFRRWPGSTNPTRRALGSYGELTLAEAREKARGWLELASRGVDPSHETKRRQQAAIEAERAKQAATFGAALDSYIRRKSKLRTVHVLEGILRRELGHWLDKPLADISARDVRNTIQAIVDRGHAAAAHSVLAQTKAFFNWIVDSDNYGIEVSPCARIKATALIGPRAIGSRVLADFEIRALWHAADGLGYPSSAFFKLLLLTACRRSEVADMTRGEIDLDAGEWNIPAERMKNKLPFIMPLAPGIIALLDSLPRGIAGDFVFSTMGGAKPISGFSRIKRALDKAMKVELAKEGKEFTSFTIHDIRRTCRTQFSKLRTISSEVREALLAHSKPGLLKVYDQHDYLDEKKEALELWHARLRTIIEPRPDNVVPIRKAG